MLEIRTAEREVRSRESRYKETIQKLWPELPCVKDTENSPILGNVDSVPVVQVGATGPGRFEAGPEISRTAIYDGKEYAWVTSAWVAGRPYSIIHRAVRLTETGIPHVFGLAADDHYEIGVYVPKESLAVARRRHGDEVIKEYPAVSLTAEQIMNLNVSTHFVFGIAHEVDGEGGKELQYTRFKKILSSADAVKKFGRAEGEFIVGFERLSDRLRGLINVSLEGAVLYPLVQGYIDQDFSRDQQPNDWRWPSISLF